VLLFMGLVGCPRQESPHPIPDGVYRSASGNDSIEIAGRKVRFSLHVREPAGSDFIVKEYNYSVYPDGRLQPSFMNSSNALGGPVGRYAWYWDGTVIKRRDATGTEPSVAFTKE
jgi:hypothetical protein